MVAGAARNGVAHHSADVSQSCRSRGDNAAFRGGRNHFSVSSRPGEARYAVAIASEAKQSIARKGWIASSLRSSQ
jgi:hypothetical protein